MPRYRIMDDASSLDNESLEILSSLSEVASMWEREACLAHALGMDMARRLLGLEAEVQVYDSIHDARGSNDGALIVDIMLDHSKNEPVQEAAFKALASMLDVPVGTTRDAVIVDIKMQLASKKETCYWILEALTYFKTNVVIQTHALAVLLAYPCFMVAPDLTMGVHIGTSMILLTGFAQRIVMEAIWISTNKVGLDSFMEMHAAWTALLTRFRRVMVLVVTDQLNESRHDDESSDSGDDGDVDDLSSISSESLRLFGSETEFTDQLNESRHDEDDSSDGSSEQDDDLVSINSDSLQFLISEDDFGDQRNDSRSDDESSNGVDEDDDHSSIGSEGLLRLAHMLMMADRLTESRNEDESSNGGSAEDETSSIDSESLRLFGLAFFG